MFRVNIDAGGSGKWYFYKQSKNDYFIIRNCNITYAGNTLDDAVIKLSLKSFELVITLWNNSEIRKLLDLFS